MKELLFLLAFLFVPHVIFAQNTYYVATTGLDTNSCTQARTGTPSTTPKATIAEGIKCMSPGDTLLVRGGYYNQILNDTATTGGTSWAAPLTVKAYPGETVWMQPTSGTYIIYFASAQKYIEFDGINLDSTLNGTGALVHIQAWVSGGSGGNAHHIRFKNAEAIIGSDGTPNQDTGSGNYGFLFSLYGAVSSPIGGNEVVNMTIHGGGDSQDFAYAAYIQTADNIIKNCNIYDQVGIAIQVYGLYAQPINNIIRGNWIHDMTRGMSGYNSSGILLDGAGTKVYNNIISNIAAADGATGSSGIQLYGGGIDNNEIDNNTIYNNGGTGIVISSGATGTKVRNNIIYLQSTPVDNGGASTTQTTNITTNPGFVSAGTGNFHLAAASGTAYNTGTAVGNATTDKDGNVRPQAGSYDAGAYEFTAGSSDVCDSGACTTFYTAKTGSDANTCNDAQSTSTPRLTIGAGMLCLTPGDTLFVRTGTYAEILNNPTVAGSSWSAPVTVKNYSSETVTMKPTSGTHLIYFAGNQQYVEFDGINLDQSTQGASSASVVDIRETSTTAAHHIRFKNAEVIIGTDGTTNEDESSESFGFQLTDESATEVGGNEFINLVIHGGGDSGDASFAFYVSSSNNLIDGCEIYDTAKYGLIVYGDNPTANIIRNNTIHDITRNVTGYTSAGIFLFGTSNQIHNNVIAHIHNATGASATGIYAYHAADTLFYYNTITDNEDTGIVIDGGSGNTIQNNIIYPQSADISDSGTGTVSDHNINTNPNFMDAGTDDFRLVQPSVAFNTAVTITIVTTDIIGTVRPRDGAPDIGAYEYIAADTICEGDCPQLETLVADRFRLATGPCVLDSQPGAPVGVLTGNVCDQHIDTVTGQQWGKWTGTGTNTG